MSELTDTVLDSAKHAKESRLNSFIALTVAISATFMAVCNIKDGNIVQAMSQAQSHSVNAWSYFQAKSTKQLITENTLMLLEDNKLASREQKNKLESKILQYTKEKEEIKLKAEGFEKEYDNLNVFDDQFDMTDAFLSISIALFGITALTQKRWLFYFASGLSSTGIFFGVMAFMKISVQLGFISKILG